MSITIASTKENWEVYSSAVHKVDRNNVANDFVKVIPRCEDCARDFMEEFSRVADEHPEEGNFRPVIIGEIIGADIVNSIVCQVRGCFEANGNHTLTDTQMADISARVSQDYGLPLAAFAFEKYQQELIAEAVAGN